MLYGGVLCKTGLKRMVNQDRAKLMLSGETGLCFVADGMGGTMPVKRRAMRSRTNYPCGGSASIRTRRTGRSKSSRNLSKPFFIRALHTFGNKRRRINYVVLQSSCCGFRWTITSYCQQEIAGVIGFALNGLERRYDSLHRTMSITQKKHLTSTWRAN